MSTIKRVAESAGVSVATVSRVVNSSGFVRPELRDRVEIAMKELRYRPSALARGLRVQQTRTIGILVPKLDHPFFGALAFAIEQALFARGYRSFMCSANENLERENVYLEMLVSQRVDGVIMVPTGRDANGVRRLREQNVPVVTVDRAPSENDADAVSIDNFNGARALATHLLELGHTRIAVLSPPETSEPIRHRLQGIRQAFLSRGLEFDEGLLLTGPLEQFEMGYQGGTTLLAKHERPSAIMALTDVTAVGVLHAAHDLGLRVPQDLSVTGFDDIPLAQHALPGLTTVAQPIYEMGLKAVELMLQRLVQPDANLEAVLLPASLVVRGSSAAPSSGKSQSSSQSQKSARKKS
jgi:LacI family transcriptional regulator